MFCVNSVLTKKYLVSFRGVFNTIICSTRSTREIFHECCNLHYGRADLWRLEHLVGRIDTPMIQTQSPEFPSTRPITETIVTHGLLCPDNRQSQYPE